MAAFAVKRPTVVLLPGAWHDAEAYCHVVPLLNKAGYSSVALDLPSVAAEPPHKSIAKDAATIRSTVGALVEAGEHVIVVMHSYSGICGCEALQGLGFPERRSHNKAGGVVRLVFIAAVALLEGMSLISSLEGFSKKPSFRISDDGLYVWFEGARDGFYNDLNDEVADYHVKKLKHHSMKTFEDNLMYAAWRYIPSTYVICENDQAFAAEAQEAQVAAAQAAQPGAFDVVERIATSHSPFLSKPLTLVNCIRRAAGERV